MNSNLKKIVIVVLLIVIGIAIGLAIPAIKEKREDFDNYAKARDAAEDKEEFDKNFDNMVKWFDDYKEENPEASDEEAQEAFDALWD